MNDGFLYRCRVDARDAGRPLDRFLAAAFDHSSRARWRERIECGLVRVDGARTAPHVVLESGQEITWDRPPWREPDAPLEFALRFDDGDVLVVEKPAGLPTLPGAGFHRHTLAHLVGETHPGAVAMHRLGRWTSGLVLFARSREARRSIASQFAARSVSKRYRTLVSGRPPEDRFAVETPIGPVPHALLGTVHGASASGKPARSRVTVLERAADRSLCEVAIETGRPHQIRIHLAAAGHPLVGDPLYTSGGRPEPDCRALPGDPGYTLHARALGFDDPRSGERVRVISPAGSVRLRHASDRESPAARGRPRRPDIST